ncbi:MAG TPA: winged helix-turn-helix domain-containing protein [Thermoanaerobaculia bacterium]|nr:winged helix-turn-helix domain-containing protein [Thermoanaerobaculia bacterium]
MASSSRLFFDGFELRLDSGELLRDGSPVTTLQPQPARVLELLASRSGEVVSREEIRQLIWGESFVDFDASLNFCVKQIRRALGDSATSPRYLETLPRRGYRFLRPVRVEMATNGNGVPVPEPLPEAPSSRPAPQRRWPLLTGISVTAAALILLVFLIASRFPASLQNARLAVFPLACRDAGPAGRQICGGVTEALTAELARQLPHEVEVIAPTSVLVYQGSRKSIREIGEELGATYLLTGEVDPSGGHLRIDARLTTADEKALWHQEGPATEMAEAPLVYGEIVRGVAKALRLPLPAATPPAAEPRKEAYEAYLRGIYLARQRKFDDAVSILQEATLLDDQFARAYAELARARVSRSRPPQEDGPASLAAARKALELDPQLAEGHLALGEVLFKDRLDWQRAGAEYRQAVALAPGDAETHYAYATYLTALGRHDEAIAAIERARELDPASMAIASDYSWFLYIARRYGDAIRQARDTLKLLDMTQGSLPAVAQYGRSWAYWVLVHGSLSKGDEQTAVDTIRNRMREIGEGAAAERLGSLREILDYRVQYVARKAPGDSYAMAAVNAAAGHTDEALGYLERLCRNGGEGPMLNFVPVEPVFDPLHGDPRFARIVDCSGLPRDAPVRRQLEKGQ